MAVSDFGRGLPVLLRLFLRNQLGILFSSFSFPPPLVRGGSCEAGSSLGKAKGEVIGLPGGLGFSSVTLDCAIVRAGRSKPLFFGDKGSADVLEQVANARVEDNGDPKLSFKTWDGDLRGDLGVLEGEGSWGIMGGMDGCGEMDESAGLRGSQSRPGGSGGRVCEVEAGESDIAYWGGSVL